MTLLPPDPQREEKPSPEAVEHLRKLFDLDLKADNPASLDQKRRAWDQQCLQTYLPLWMHVTMVKTGLRQAMLFTPLAEPDDTTGSESERQGDRGVFLYLHGGGYCTGSVYTHRQFVSRLARRTSRQVLFIDYPLSPEVTYPAALDYAVEGYRWLLAQGTDPSKIIIAGDSSGGGLALALLVKIKILKLERPGCGVLLSPWLDMRLVAASIKKNDPYDPMVSRKMLERSALRYAGGMPLNEARLSPVLDDLTDLPPLLVQAASKEVLVDDAKFLAERGRAAGVSVDLALWRGMWHFWQDNAGELPEADLALDEVNLFLNIVAGIVPAYDPDYVEEEIPEADEQKTKIEAQVKEPKTEVAKPKWY